jgi:maleate isomerase
MNGWRARLGLIVPSTNTVNEPEFYRNLPEGISLHTSRMRLGAVTAEKLEGMADDIERCAKLLKTANVDVIAYGCTTGSLVKGVGYDKEIESRLEEVSGIPTVATAASIKRAFDALNISSLSITTPYIQDLNNREVEFLQDAGYDVLEIEGLGLTSNLDIGAQRPETAYCRARSVADADPDGIFISCTNYRTFEIIEHLESDLGKPVVTSNQATLWNALKTLEVDYSDLSLGQLFEY